MHKLFESFARWYDLHTPPGHYFRDHELVLSLAAQFGQGARILDVGCGTGVLLEKARAAGFDATGFDVSAPMIRQAKKRLETSSVWVQRMQDLATRDSHDIVVSLSWCVHYCDHLEDLRVAISNMKNSLVAGGRLLLQVAHGPNLHSDWCEDRETGPTGIVDDVKLRFRFQPDATRIDTLLAEYEFVCASTGDSFHETHKLNGTNANLVAEVVRGVGLGDVEIWNSWRGDLFTDGGNVFVTGVR